MPVHKPNATDVPDAFFFQDGYDTQTAPAGSKAGLKEILEGGVQLYVIVYHHTLVVPPGRV